ncbi:DUF6471 domain-containing protein [Paraburkholderia sp. EG287A]|uniref:DUF6471 domain-containing protein n=1 Tax=Paraburkholderia sp. EG287A TaxID=3237012 RepID=UPI0034D243D5
MRGIIFGNFYCHLSLGYFFSQARNLVSEVDTPWSGMASRVVRVALARKDCSYSRLSEALVSVGVKESESALASRVSRGRIRLALLLQIFSVTNSKAPQLWSAALAQSGKWEERAAAVVAAELSRHPTVSVTELAQRMLRLGADLTEKTLVSHLTHGTISLPAFLQALVALGSTSLDYYVDYDDLVTAFEAPPAVA